MKIIYISILIGFAVLNAKVIHKTYNGETISISISKKSVNRLVLPYKIKKKIFSAEKGLSITIDGTDAYIKYNPKKKDKLFSEDSKDNKIIESNIVYSGFKSAETFLITTGGTYSFVFKPSDIESSTIYIDDNRFKVDEICKIENKENEYIKRLKLFTRNTISNKIDNSFKHYYQNKKIHKYLFVTDKYIGNQYIIYKIKMIHDKIDNIENLLSSKLHVRVLSYTYFENSLIVIGENHGQ